MRAMLQYIIYVEIRRRRASKIRNRLAFSLLFVVTTFGQAVPEHVVGRHEEGVDRLVLVPAAEVLPAAILHLQRPPSRVVSGSGAPWVRKGRGVSGRRGAVRESRTGCVRQVRAGCAGAAAAGRPARRALWGEHALVCTRLGSHAHAPGQRRRRACPAPATRCPRCCSRSGCTGCRAGSRRRARSPARSAAGRPQRGRG